jgi:N-acyl homoserine lactone hydrolase
MPTAGSTTKVIPIPVSTFVYPDGPLKGQRGVVMAFAVGVGSRWILFDNGIGRGDPEIDAIYKPEGPDLLEELAWWGIEPHQVEGIANSHLHFDHCGQNSLFPGIPLWVQREEWDAAQAADYTVRAWIEFPSAEYRLVSGWASPLPGVVIAPTPGHTPGHQSLILELGGDKVILSGQACYSPQEWMATGEGVDGRSGAWDPDAYVRSLADLRAAEPDSVWFSHSTTPWHRRDHVGPGPMVTSAEVAHAPNDVA